MKQKNINSKFSSGNDVLNRSYIDQNFPYSTILLHKLAISTYCVNNADKKIFTSKLFVYQIPSALSVAKPSYLLLIT